MTKQKHIMLVEDDPNDEALTLDALRSGGFEREVTVARDGAEALDLLFGAQSDPTGYVLVILDIKLPKVNGLDVLRKIRAHPQTRLLPVVLLTSSSEDEDVLNGYVRGANSYVRKPVEFERFVEAVRALSAYWILYNVAAA